MQTRSSGIEDDADIRAALEWFQQVAEDHSGLLQRMRTAQAYLRSRFVSTDLVWPEPEDLVERWVSLGCSAQHRLLVVVHTFTPTGANTALVRLISARPATPGERKQYEDG